MKTHRIAVLGAGLAGLAAATRLSKSGHDVSVYEARNRVGGRVWSETIATADGPHVIERGAEFILDGYTTTRRYCAEHKLELVDTGMSYYIRVPADRPRVTTEAMASLGHTAAREAARGSGARSVADVLDAVGATGDVREALEARIEMSTAVRVEQVTAEETLDHVASFEPGPSWRIRGGNQLLPRAMAHALGGRVRLQQVVTAVKQDTEGVDVATANGSERYDYAVIALPFAALRDNDLLELELPSAKTEALSRVVQGNAAKLHIPLDAVPASSAVMSVVDRFWTWTACETAGNVAPVLNCFGGELEHLRALGMEDGSDEWAQRVRALRSDLPLAATGATVTAWPLDPLARGSYTAHAPGFTSDDAEVLAAPDGRLAFAGEYIDREFTGLLEGALRSGDAAAESVMALISEVAA